MTNVSIRPTGAASDKFAAFRFFAGNLSKLFTIGWPARGSKISIPLKTITVPYLARLLRILGQSERAFRWSGKPGKGEHMLGLHRNLLAGAAGLALIVGGMSGAMAGPLVIAPSAPNNGQGAVSSTAVAPFDTSGGQFNFGSDLVVQSLPGVGGTVGSTEYGSLYFTGLGVDNSVSGLGTGYDLLATFKITGDGTWTGTEYSLSSNIVIAMTLYGVPGGTLPPGTLGTPNAGAGNFGITIPAGSKTLGTLSFEPALGDQANAIDNLAGKGTTNLSAELLPDLNSDFTGPNGFFNNVLGNGMALNLDTSDSSTLPETAVTHVASGTDGCTNASGCDEFLSQYQTLTSGPNGSANFAVPEPGSLILLGSMLLGFGVEARRRRNRKTEA
jgi:hypothetical protein